MGVLFPEVENFGLGVVMSLREPLREWEVLLMFDYWSSEVAGLDSPLLDIKNLGGSTE